MSASPSYQPRTAHSLRNLYYTRTVVQFLWAVIILASAIDHPALAAGFLILYPLWDVACTVYDLKSRIKAASADATAQYLNAAFGVAAAVGIALTVFKTPQNAVATFGAWACAAGLLQLVVGVSRRKSLGGQWAMILSGLQSTAAGVAFLVGGLSGKVHVKDLGGYAIFGAVYFLIAAFLMNRRVSRLSPQGAAAALSLGLIALSMTTTLSA